MVPKSTVCSIVPMNHASSADFPRSRAKVRPPVIAACLLLGLVAFLSLACAASKDDEAEACEPYSCACGTGVRESGSNGAAPRCAGAPFCNEVGDCPNAETGTSEPICESFGDQVINGYSGSCRLPCANDEECPDGAFCDSFCWFEAED